MRVPSKINLPTWMKGPPFTLHSNSLQGRRTSKSAIALTQTRRRNGQTLIRGTILKSTDMAVNSANVVARDTKSTKRHTL